jgi:hypothetical protein
MGYLSDNLRAMGYSPTGESSPVDDDAMLWSDGTELICDGTATVIDGNHHSSQESSETVHRYPNSENVKLPGGFLREYDWGHDGDEFRY